MPKIVNKNPSFTLDSSTYALQISNLHWNVSQDGIFYILNLDLKQLFGDYKGFASVKLKYDAAGRSLGEATVVYEIEESADAALQFFDNRHFDGMPIQIKKLKHKSFRRAGSGVNSRLGPSLAINSRLGPSVNSRLGPSVNARLGPKSIHSDKSKMITVKEKVREIVSYHEV